MKGMLPGKQFNARSASTLKSYFVLCSMFLMAMLVSMAGTAVLSAEEVLPAPPEDVVITFEGLAYVNMPIWAHISGSVEQDNLRYPFGYEPWFWWGHDFEVTRDGQPVPRMQHAGEYPQMFGGAVGGSCAPPTSPRDRLPLHLFYRFDQPGIYMVRYTYSAPDFSHKSKVTQTSEWTPLEVKPLTPGQREAWLKEQIAKAPNDDAGMMVGDYLPSLLACPDDKVLPALLDALNNPSELVQSCALKGLHYYPDDVRGRAVMRVIKEKGPTKPLVWELWAKSSFHPQVRQLVDSIIPYLRSNSAVHAGAAVQAIYLMRWSPPSLPPDLRAKMNKAVWAAAPHILALKDPEALRPLVQFVGAEKSDRSRQLLWKLSSDQSVRQEALSCLCWIGDIRDLPKLGPLLLSYEKDESAVTSLPHDLMEAFGEKATPYLLKGLQDSPNRSVRIRCAKELAHVNRVEAFYFYRDELAGNSPEKLQLMLNLRDRFMENQNATEEQTRAFVDAKIRELQK